MKLPADLTASVRPHHLHRRWLGIVVTLGVAVFVGGAFAIPSVVMKRHEDVLAGFSPIFTPEQRDVARCGQCEASFERTDGGAWRRQDPRS